MFITHSMHSICTKYKCDIIYYSTYYATHSQHYNSYESCAALRACCTTIRCMHFSYANQRRQQQQLTMRTSRTTDDILCAIRASQLVVVVDGAGVVGVGIIIAVWRAANVFTWFRVSVYCVVVVHVFVCVC